MAWLDGKKKQDKLSTYKNILSQHSTQKPQAMGGAPNLGAVTPLCQVTPAIGGGGLVQVVIPLPNSFRPNDGRAVDGAGWGFDKDAAEEAAARQVVAKLLWQSPHEVRLLDKNWHGGADDVRWQAAGRTPFGGPQPETPLSGQPVGKKLSGFQVPGPWEDREAERRDLLGRIIQYHHALDPPQDPNPSDLRREKLGGFQSWFAFSNPPP
jgi:hypothetical protein